MGLSDDLNRMVSDYLVGDYETYEPQGVPNPEDIALGNKAAKLSATTLFIDVRQSSDITNAFRRQTAAKMMKSYFDGAVRIINNNEGKVRSFNGDGMLAIFVGGTRSNNAVKAAMQVKWFVLRVLQSKFNRYFENNQAAAGQALAFSIGCGLDDGEIFAVRVGIRGTNDVAWVGRCTNTSAKLANDASSPQEIAITRAIYQRLNDDRKYASKSGKHMWSDERLLEIGGTTRAIRTTSYWWGIP
jgi:class 3 adenylate cyclase